ncbi:hypothetical protein LEP1GSC178_2336 [Leptospira licerasiae str. MMD4847]|uniref:Uncharacterized protein n=1 Tax=Leptospira licerasiae str. MMD4847 TaxID=1049971 RepID=A0ABN0HEH8_9LEPT|nr:hypothetical protein LEP1GSC178_2336 [Leptospira licerasiae str. MMD4847]
MSVFSIASENKAERFVPAKYSSQPEESTIFKVGPSLFQF